MSLLPKLKRILLPPTIPPSSILGPKLNTVETASTLLSAQIDFNTACVKSAGESASTTTAGINQSNNNTNIPPTPPLQRHVTLHPSKSLVAFVLNPVDVSISSNIYKVVVVQNTATKEIITSMSWIDVAAALYSETDAKKLHAAAKSLGVIQSLQFYDPAILYWSRVMTTATPNKSTTTTPTTVHDRFLSLAIQTDKRVILLNLRKGCNSNQVLLHSNAVAVQSQQSSTQRKSPYRTILAHFCEKSIGAVPSSNILPLTDRWILIGCVDGSMKCYDWITGSTVKKIKGLGKGDWIVKLLAANRYHTDPSATSVQGGGSASGLRRILTVTKKGIVYLIEIEVDPEKNAMDIQPPLGRFYIGSPVEVPAFDSTVPAADVNTASAKDGSGISSSNVTDAGGPIIEHSIVSYDPHMDRLLWLTTIGANKKGNQTLSVWNLRALQQDFIQQANLASSSGSSSKNLFKPDPTLIIQFPTTSANMSNVAVISIHPAFTSDTVICATISTSGEFFLHGAVGLAANTTQTVVATPVLGINLTTILTQAVPSLDEQPNELRQVGDAGGSSLVRVHASASQSLPSSGCSEILVATNVGMLVLELPTLNTKGTHHCHFGAGLGNVGKSVLMVQHSIVEYATVDALTGNPVGLLEPKNPTVVYECPTAKKMPIEFQKRPFRNPPTFITSPSGMYVCLLWSTEFRYEILHIPTVLQKLGQRIIGPSVAGAGGDLSTSTTRNAVVASGYGVADFAWIGDEDMFCVLHAEELIEQSSIYVPKKIEGGDGGYSLEQNQRVSALGNVASMATSVTMSATSGAVNAVTKGATSAANKTVEVATQGVRVGAKAVTKSVMKSFMMFGGGKGKKKRGGDGSDIGSSITADDDEDEHENGPGSAVFNVPSAAELATLEQNMRNMPQISEVRQRYVEMKRLDPAEGSSNTSEITNIIPATVRSLGELTLRGGKRTRPAALFGGPVLCVASRSSDDDKGGEAYFYTRKRLVGGEKDNNVIQASSYGSSGPTIPYPDFITWDDDGYLCAVAIENRVAVYYSNEPDFVLLGSVRITSPTMVNADVTSMRFVHGTLFCCTFNSVHCILLGDFENRGVCKLDTYLLSSTDVPMIPQKIQDDKFILFAPTPISLPLVQPTILGYQSGSLLLSTLRGVQAVPLHCPLLRIGLLLAGGHIERATRWLDAVPNNEHEEVASFLERRGRPELALQLPGLSLETIVDMSMRYGYVDRLEEVVETFGVSGLRSIDMGRGVSPSIFGPDSTTQSVVVCIGAYLLAHGRVELTRRLATECLRLGDDGRKDAFSLGTLLLPVDEADANRLITRAVEESGMADDWLIGKFARDYALSTAPRRT